jgi:hypothetical protein
MFDMENVDKFIIYLGTTFQMPSSNGSLAIAAKGTAKYKLHGVLRRFTFYKKLLKQKLHVLRRLLGLHTGPYVSGDGIAPASKVRTAAMLVILTAGN